MKIPPRASQILHLSPFHFPGFFLALAASNPVSAFRWGIPQASPFPAFMGE
jgi:hypothetical protein